MALGAEPRGTPTHFREARLRIGSGLATPGSQPVVGELGSSVVMQTPSPSGRAFVRSTGTWTVG
jgi:hypothetical protein